MFATPSTTPSPFPKKYTSHITSHIWEQIILAIPTRRSKQPNNSLGVFLQLSKHQIVTDTNSRCTHLYLYTPLTNHISVPYTNTFQSAHELRSQITASHHLSHHTTHFQVHQQVHPDTDTDTRQGCYTGRVVGCLVRSLRPDSLAVSLPPPATLPYSPVTRIGTSWKQPRTLRVARFHTMMVT